MKIENISFESDQKTCSKKTATGGVPCPYMSTALFQPDGRMFWKCKLFNTELEDQDKWLIRCKECIEEFSK